LEDVPQATCLDRLASLEPGRPQGDAAPLADAVPGLRGGDPGDLVGDLGIARRWVEVDGQGLHARWFVLAHDQLATARARPPVDPAERIARVILADAEQLDARACPRRGRARLHAACLPSDG